MLASNVTGQASQAQTEQGKRGRLWNRWSTLIWDFGWRWSQNAVEKDYVLPPVTAHCQTMTTAIRPSTSTRRDGGGATGVVVAAT